MEPCTLSRAISFPPVAKMLSAVLWLSLVGVTSLSAQTSATDGKTPSGLAPGSPAGSYALSGFESVNLYNGSLSFRLPLKGVGGRGASGYTVMLPIEQKWVIKAGASNPFGTTPLSPNPNWWQGIKPGYGPGVMHGRRAAHEDSRSYVPDGSGGQTGILAEVWLRTLTRLTFTGADGTEYELRDQLTGGEPRAEKWDPETGDHEGFSRGTVFVTADGSSATFISDAHVSDYVSPNMAQSKRLFYPSGVLLLADGTRYRVSGGKVTSITDRNGNRATFAYLASGNRLSAATDQLGRQVTFTYNDGVRGYDEISYKGFGAAARRVRVWYASLLARLRPGSGYTLKTYHQLFPLNSASTTTQYNPSRVSEVEPPDGRRYKLYYNPYGELARVELPTGGAYEYDWDGVTDADNAVIFRHVTERRVYASAGSTPTHKVLYARTAEGAGSTVEVKTADAAGALLSMSRHYFYGDAFSSMMEDPSRPSAVSYGTWREGMEYKTEELASDGTTVLRRVEQTWAQRAPIPWWTLGADLEPPNDPRVTQTITTLADVHPDLVSKQTYAYDQYNNRTDSYEYDFGAGAAGPLIRRTHTDYVTAAAYVGVDADPTLGAHLRSLPSQTWVSSDVAGNAKVSRTAYEYDNYSDAEADTRHDLLAAYTDTGIIGHDTAGYPATFARRGNVTGVTSYTDATAQTGAVTVSTTYDIAGNPLKTVDARGHVSSVGYADSFSNPASGTGAFTPYTYAFQTSAASPVPDASGTYGSSTALTTSTKYDFWAGLVFSMTDANGKVTTVEYNAADELDRPKAVVRPDGGRTDYEYGDAVGNLYVRTQTDLDASRRTDSYQYFDRLGRPYRSISYENHDTVAPWITVDTEYDALGRVKRTSLPYRAAGGAALFSTDKWAEHAYDALGRITAVTTKPDDAAVMTSYSGNQMTATDQAGKKRRSTADALGRLVRVDEPNASGALDVSGSPAQPTHYTYDALGNLRKVTQGAQLRFFMYNSLSRLTRAKHPEQSANASITGTDPVTGNTQWSLSYSYDAAGNLTSKTDARNVTATYTYDALGRNRTVNYSDATPDVTRYYDLATLGKGRRWKSEAAGVSRTIVSQYDALGRPKASAQQFWVSGAWGTSFSVMRAYDEAGNVASQTYPSGHTTAYSYDRLGRPASFTGTLGDGAERDYSTGALYDELGGVSQEKLGTATPVYNKRRYNERGQLASIRFGTTAGDDGWNRGAIRLVYSPSAEWNESRPDNNGNLRKQVIYLPHGENPTGGDGWTEFVQYYEYDQLNRLSSVEEKLGDQAVSFRQAYTYDRWGNRKIDAALTTGPVNEQQFAVNTANNRLGVPAGQAGVMGYDAAGNLISDTYTGTGTRSYDAENRMTTAQFLSGQLQTATYRYDADGRRVKRDAGAAAEVWHVYGIGGELLAEYAAGAAPSSPQKEYGYRAGQLLVTLKAGQQVNVALSSNGAAATASSTNDTNRLPAAAINGDRRGLHYGSDPVTGSAWVDATQNAFPDWLEVAFDGSKTISEISVFGLQDNYATPQEPTEAMMGTGYGLMAFDVQYWTGSAWATVPGGSVTGNTKVWRKFTFPAITTSKIRVVTYGGGAGYSRIVELEAWGQGAEARWLVADHLGTPRMVIDAAGQLSGISRHDYLPFGEEVGAGVGGRTTPRGYSRPDSVRQHFTGQERDNETGLDYFGARYFSNEQGRFTSPDPLLTSGTIYDPQTWNRYAYTIGNPLKYTDPFGMYICNGSADQCKQIEKGLKNLEKARDSFKKGSREYKQLDRARQAFGNAGVDNGVTIQFGTIKDGGPAQASIGIGDKNGTKDVTPANPTGQQTIVTIDPNQHNDADDYVQTLGHEGSHVADGADLVAAIPTKMADAAAVAAVLGGPLNLTKYVTETNAYQVSSLIAQARRNPSLLMGKAKHEIWNSGWSESDRAAKRAAGIDKVLAEPKPPNGTGLYEVTRASQGVKLIPYP